MQVSRTTFLLSMLVFLALGGLFVYVFVTGAAPSALTRLLPASEDEQFNNLSSEIEVTTDKPEYLLADHSADSIRITVKNPLDQEILTHVGSMTSIYALEAVQKLGNDAKWKRLYAHCVYPKCRYVEDSPVAIASQQSRSFKWKPVLFVDGTTRESAIEPGEYRVLVRFQLTRGRTADNWLLAASNTFTIR